MNFICFQSAEIYKTEANVSTKEIRFSLDPSKEKKKTDAQLRGSKPTSVKASQIINNALVTKECSYFGNYVAQKMNNYNKNTQVEIEYEIYRLFHEVDMKMLQTTLLHNTYSYSEVIFPPTI